MSWLKRKTTYVTDPETGEPRATSRTITYPGGRVETVPAADLVGVKLEERRMAQAAYGEYRAPGVTRTPTEMRTRADELARELGLKPKQQRATAKCQCDCDECLGGKCDDCTDPECDDPNCEGCPNQDRSAMPAAQGRTIYPFDRAALQQQRELDAQIYEARRLRKLAAAR
jgi:hypothetical protein